MKLKFKLTPEQLKKPLLILASVAVVLGLITYFVVFYNPGYVAPNTTGADTGTASGVGTSTAIGLSSSTASSTAANASSTASSTATDTSGAIVAWNENGNSFSLNSASIADDQLTLTLTAQPASAGATAANNGCVPADLSFIADEAGTLQPPVASSSTPPNAAGTCQTSMTFSVNPANFPLLFTTGGTSNIFFEVATATASDALQIELPGNSG